MKSILVPASVIDQVRELSAAVVHGAEFLPYAEDASGVEGADRADAIYRWIAGKRFSELVEQNPRITWLHTASAGVDHVLTPSVKCRPGMVVTDSGPAFGPAIAEFVLATMLSVTRSLPEIATNQREHRWKHVDQRELYGTTIGIIGLGPIGLAIAKRAKAFDMKTIGLRRSGAAAENVDEVVTGPDGLRKLVSKSDTIVIAAALTGETKHLIGEAQLKAMKPGSWIINIARGGLVDEAALIAALRSGTIGGAILDVFAQEPLPPTSPLWDLPNVIISPHHSGGGTTGLRKRQLEIFIENVRRYIAGDGLLNVVDIERGY